MAWWIRWLHVYSSMLGLGALAFFSATGITLNHPDWLFGSQRRQEDLTGSVPAVWVAPSLPETEVRRLELVEWLRREKGARGYVEEVRVDEREVFLSFKGPGYSADAWVDRIAGDLRMTVARDGWVAVLNDLHKGRHAGPAWSWLIDLSAGLLLVLSVSGFLLLLYLKRRRGSGLLVGLAGLLVLAALARWWGV